MGAMIFDGKNEILMILTQDETRCHTYKPCLFVIWYQMNNVNRFFSVTFSLVKMWMMVVFKFFG
jgi:hypothetical protein